jgi:hypothetical protein
MTSHGFLRVKEEGSEECLALWNVDAQSDRRKRDGGALMDRLRSVGYFEVCRMSGYGMTAYGGKVDVRGLGSKVCRGPPVHRPSLHSRYRFAAADPGPLVRSALLDICAVKSSILERSSLRIGEVFALL